VVHAGLSLLLVFLNLLLYKKDKELVSLSNNLLIVQEAMEIKDAMEDGHQVPLTMLEIMVFQHKLNIHM
jgi:hypothetical protein